jgi:hypothetical protein
MHDSTRTPGTAVQSYTPDTDGWDSPIDYLGVRRGCQIRGSLLTYVDKQYFAGSGKFKEEIPIGTHLVALAVYAGWKRWQDGKVAEFVTEMEGRYPQRHKLGYDDESAWACGPGGKPSDPWQNSRVVVLINRDDYSEYTFCTSSGGGRSAVDALRNSMMSARLLQPGQLPIVELGWKPMSTSFGMKSKPSLKIVGWWKSETANHTTAALDDSLNDPIPDLSN